MLNIARNVSLVGIILDQGSAYLMRQYFPGLVHSTVLIGSLQRFEAWILVALGLGLLVQRAQKNPRLVAGCWLLGMGFLSNMLSQLFYGGFTDYIPTGISYINIADLLVVAGCIFFYREHTH